MKRNNKRIVKNTLFLYFRMFLTMGVTLYTSRIVLNVLGVDNYGTYTVVGGVVAMFAFFNTAMSSATQRFLAIDIGENDWERLKKTFNSALLIHIGIALLLLVIGETVGLWFVNNKLNLSEDSMRGANFVYQFSILASIITITQVPFNALIIVRERMNVFAMISIVEVLLKLLIVYLLFISPFDKLKTYAVLIVLVALITSTIYKLYCLRKFKESRFAIYKDKVYYKTLISYSGWNLFGNIAAVARGQGINIILNIFFGTVVNAAYGVMLQVQSAVTAFVINFQTAVNPQIYKSYAENDFGRMQNLLFQSSKFSFYLILLLVSPIIYNIQFVMQLWLKIPPEYAADFTSLMLINLLIESISYPLITGALATGKIKYYQIIVGSILFANFPFTYLLFEMKFGAVSFLYVAIVFSLCALFLRLMFLKKMISFDVKLFFKTVLVPICGVSLLSYFSGLLLGMALGVTANPFQLFKSVLSIVVSVLCWIYLIGLQVKERDLLISMIKKKVQR